MKTIRMQIISVILIVVIVLCLSIGLITSWLNYSTATDILKQNMTETSQVAAERVAAEILNIQNAAMQAGVNEDICSRDITVERKKEIIAEQAEIYGFTRGNLLDASGDSLFDENNYSERDYFKASINGKTYISDPTVSKVTGKVSFLVSAPVWKNSDINTEVIGVVYFVPDEDFLNAIVEGIKVSESGYSYIINKNGTSVADTNRELVGVENSIEQAKTDTTLTQLSEIENKMILGENGFGEYFYNDATWVQGYSPIANTSGWSIGVTAKQSDFLGGFYNAIIATIICAVVFIILSVLVAVKYANKLSKPIKYCSERLLLLSKGDLATPIEKSLRKDEVGLLQNSSKVVVENLQAVVMDISNLLKEIANRNLDVKTSAQYEGDFAPVKDATLHITEALNESMNSIYQSAIKVSGSSDQVSNGAQALAQGATQQASSIEELSAAISLIASQIKENAQNAQSAKEKSEIADKSIVNSNERMKEMITAMNHINKTSDEIGKIIKTIEDIAFQTNILALNAAVEAARAGEAGKGFAVVADEVRNLASKSAQASKNTTLLIDESIKAIEEGCTIAADATDAMKSVVSATKEVIDLVETISVSSQEQAISAQQVSLGVDQISEVIQTNSATAQESAATSQELSSQAKFLDDLVSQFKLKK